MQPASVVLISGRAHRGRGALNRGALRSAGPDVGHPGSVSLLRGSATRPHVIHGGESEYDERGGVLLEELFDNLALTGLAELRQIRSRSASAASAVAAEARPFSKRWQWLCRISPAWSSWALVLPVQSEPPGGDELRRETPRAQEGMPGSRGLPDHAVLHLERAVEHVQRPVVVGDDDDAASCSWATLRNSSITCRPRTLSSAAVGSSARTRLGRLASAPATATRCCSPPESLLGRWPARSATPRYSSSSSARARASRPECAVDLHGQADVLGGRQERDEVRLLEDEADVLPADSGGRRPGSGGPRTRARRRWRCARRRAAGSGRAW